MPTDNRTSASSTWRGRTGHRGVGHDRRNLDERLDAAERLRQREQLRRLADRDGPVARRPPVEAAVARDERHHAAAVPHLACCERGLGMRVRTFRRARDSSPSDVVPSREESGHREGVGGVAFQRIASVRRPRRTRKQSKGPGTAPIAFWRKRSRSCELRIAGDHDAADDVRVSGQVLRRRVEDDVGARARAGAGRTGMRTCCRRPRAAGPRRRPGDRPRPPSLPRCR